MEAIKIQDSIFIRDCSMITTCATVVPMLFSESKYIGKENNECQ